ncbi:hypothetical protein HDU96_000906 [Phlyctochytrium bullatum]|nr:hypothetical protein HDU96_000906 [Phlyctochytrium bullatum]
MDPTKRHHFQAAATSDAPWSQMLSATSGAQLDAAARQTLFVPQPQPSASPASMSHHEILLAAATLSSSRRQVVGANHFPPYATPPATTQQQPLHGHQVAMHMPPPPPPQSNLNHHHHQSPWMTQGPPVQPPPTWQGLSDGDFRGHPDLLPLDLQLTTTSMLLGSRPATVPSQPTPTSANFLDDFSSMRFQPPPVPTAHSAPLQFMPNTPYSTAPVNPNLPTNTNYTLPSPPHTFLTLSEADRRHLSNQRLPQPVELASGSLPPGPVSPVRVLSTPTQTPKLAITHPQELPLVAPTYDTHPLSMPVQPPHPYIDQSPIYSSSMTRTPSTSTQFLQGGDAAGLVHAYPAMSAVHRPTTSPPTPVQHLQLTNLHPPLPVMQPDPIALLNALEPAVPPHHQQQQQQPVSNPVAPPHHAPQLNPPPQPRNPPQPSKTSPTTAPTPAPPAPAPRPSTSKAFTEIEASCPTCSKPLARVFLYNPPTMQALAPAIACLSCRGQLAETALAQRKRKEKTGRDRDVVCKLCAVSVGCGGLRAAGAVDGGEMVEVCGVDVAVGAVAGEVYDNAKGDEEGGAGTGCVKPNFGIEVVCMDCIENFQFCTKCGGGEFLFARLLATSSFLTVFPLTGGQWRTGRWRPKQLFDAGRRTCNLPHLRLGDPSKFKFVCYRLPVHNPGSEPVNHLEGFVHANETMSAVPYTHLPLPQAIDRMAEDVMRFWDVASVTNMADAQTMKAFSYASTWDDLVRTKEMLKDQLGMLVRGQFGPQFRPEEYAGRPFRRFLTLGFSPAAEKPSAAARKSASPSAGGDAEDGLRGHRIVACIAHQWDIWDHTVVARFSCTLGQYGFHPSSILPKLNYAAGERILTRREEIATAGGMPRFVWGLAVWGRGIERTRKSFLRSLISRGTLTIEGWCRETGEREEDVRRTLRDYLMVKEDMDKRDIVIMPLDALLTLLKMD